MGQKLSTSLLALAAIALAAGGCAVLSHDDAPGAAEQEAQPIDRLFRALPDDAKRERAPFTKDAIDAVFPWNAKMATSLASFTEERLEARKKELATPAGAHSLGKDAKVLMSPAYVGHVLGSYGKI